jgi:hypothetical protein
MVNTSSGAGGDRHQRQPRVHRRQAWRDRPHPGSGSRLCRSEPPHQRRLPGYIDPPMMGRFTGGTPKGRAKVIADEPVGRMGKPEEIAAAVIWLCSDAAAFMVGHAMVIDSAKRCSNVRVDTLLCRLAFVRVDDSPRHLLLRTASGRYPEPPQLATRGLISP